MQKHRAPYEVGFSSLDGEFALEALAVEGELPSWLSGTLVRTGPAKFEIEGRSLNHWFDGFAMLHRFSVDRGRVSYQNRFLESRAYLEAKRKKKVVLREFATDPCRKIFGRVMSLFDRFSDNANVNVGKLAGRSVAMTETPHPISFDQTTLATLPSVHWEDDLHGHVTTAHPLFDAKKKTHYSYEIRFGRKSEYSIWSLAESSKTRARIAKLELDEPSYMHSFAMSENYVILTEPPHTVKPLELKLGGRPFIENYRWKKDRGTLFRVFDKSGAGLLATFETDPFFAFHHVNAFEEDGAILLDVIAYPDPSIIDAFYLDRARAETTGGRAAGRIYRFRLPLEQKTRVAGGLELSKIDLELPRIHASRVSTRKHRYVWACSARRPGNFLDQLVKLDLEDRSSLVWSEDGCYPGEPVFVATPHSIEEDRGLLLSVVLDVRRSRSFLLVLDATTLQEVARVAVPHHIPFGFHGQWFGQTSCLAD
jgi:carotenoid cleavage dioxygenase-like enzyme